MDYAHYTAHQLAQDERFQAWVLHPSYEDQLFWENWLEEHPHRRAEVVQARTLLLGWHFEEPPVSPEEIARLRRKVMQSAATESTHRPGVALRRWAYGGIAATVALLLATFVFWWVRSYPPWDTHQTGYGEVETFYLPDSSEVTLNANSHVRYASHWDASESRQVWLEGEAYFKVTRQALPASASSDEASLRKFLVIANALEIAVVGTQFNVYARPAKTEVVLEEGVVVIGLDSTSPQASLPLRMQPGEKVTYQQQQLSQQTIDPKEYTSWRNRRLVFDAVPLQQVAQKIEEIYGVEVIFSDRELAQQTFTGTVPSANLNVLLEALTGIYRLQITRQDQQLIFRQSSE